MPTGSSTTSSSTSPRTQKQAIIETAERNGLEVEFLPPQIWDGQVTKRDAVLQAALPGSDWVMVLDADWKIHGERDEIRAELEAFLAEGIDQVAVNFIQPDDPTRGWDEKAANEWHIRQTNSGSRWHSSIGRIRRCTTARTTGACYAIDKDGRKIGLFGATGTWGHEQPKTGDAPVGASVRAPLPLPGQEADPAQPGLHRETRRGGSESGIRDMNILITGSAGFIGSHLAERFEKDGHDVWGVDNFTPATSRTGTRPSSATSPRRMSSTLMLARASPI